MTTTPPTLGTAGPAAVADLLAALRGAGLQAATNLQDLGGPGVLVQPPVLHWKFGACRRADWSLLVVTGAAGRGQSLDALLRMLDIVMATLNYPAELATPDTVPTPSGALLPAYLITFTTDL